MPDPQGKHDEVQRTMSALTLLVSVVILTLGFMMYAKMNSTMRMEYAFPMPDGGELTIYREASDRTDEAFARRARDAWRSAIRVLKEN